MLRLESIELQGFKSFADRTRLQFPPGISCIVGPNGCGKSNIADAVAWVLGEQSPKSLRGERMDDVIFGGSNGRKPNAYAEVTMNWVRLEALASEDEDRLVISRRLAKNGFSEYTMNQAPCRLKDIQSALLDFGMGTKAYTIVQQGKIDTILNAKPMERRGLIEEAAGILKYKLRREESELKLKTAEDNLLRINDIIREVQKRRAQLNRQVGKARRYKQLKERLRDVENILLTAEIIRQTRMLREVIGAYEKARRREMHVNGELSRTDAQVTTLRKELLAQEKRLREQENALNQATQDITLAEENAKFKRERVVEREAQLAQLERDRQTSQDELRDVEHRAARRTKELEEVQTRLEHTADLVKQAEAREAELSASIQKETAVLEASRRIHEQHKADRHGLEVEREQMNRQREQIDFQKAATQQRIYAIEKERDGLIAEAERTRVAAEGGERDLADLSAELTQCRTDWMTLKAQRDAARETAEASAREHQRLEDKADNLRQFLQARSGLADATRMVLEASDTPLTLLRDVLDSTHESDEALDWLVEPYGDAILITSDDDQRQIERCREDRSVQLLDLRQASEEQNPIPTISGTQPALDQIVGEAPLKQALTPLLAGCAIVTSDAKIEDLARQYPHVRFIDAAGRKMMLGSWTAYREQDAAQAGFLTLKGELERTQETQHAVGQRWEDQKTALADIQNRVDALDAEIQDKRTQTAEMEKTLLIQKQRLEHLGELKKALEANRAAEQERAAELTRQIERFSQRQDEMAERVASLDAHIEESRATVVRQETAVHAAQKAGKEVTAQLLALRQKDAADQTEAARIQAEHNHLVQLREAFERKNRQSETQRLQIQKDISAFQAEIKLLQEKIEKTWAEREEAQKALHQRESSIQELRTQADALDQDIKELHGRRDDLRAEEGRHELENARISSKIAHLQEKYQANAGIPCPVDDVDPATLPDEASAEQLETERQQLEERLQNMGAVNLLAIEEFDEVDERYQFLINQQKDLLDSITEIRSTIHKLNKISSEKFTHAFAEINKRFSDNFQQLFNGGRARLALVDEDNILESGLDLLVQPPGKKLQSVSLMSGGEKALTAIALLVSIFEFRPSPFCLFDEVDAPLDEANIMRFLRKLEALKSQTQFILITHQKSTMAAASSLFGVTMEDGGCSKLVSVNFD